VCAFKGWNDAGEAATSAVSFMGAALDATRFATIDPEQFVDFQSTRPMVRLVDGVSRTIEWPEFEIHAARVPRAPRDLVVLTGPEPSYRWREFCGQVVELAEALGVQLVVTLGALLADVPHSRPVSVTAFASDESLVERLKLDPPTYEGPTGIVGVLTTALRDAGLATGSLWAAVPTYVPAAPSPKAALALVEQTARVLGTWLPTTDLEIAAASYERQVSELVAEDDETADYVRTLEDNHDRDIDQPGRSLVEEVERFLRDRGE